MHPVVAIAFWAILFVATHLVISSASVRPRMIARVGDQPFRGLYSIVAFGTLIPADHDVHAAQACGPDAVVSARFASRAWVTWFLMFAALILLVASLIRPNPGAIGAPANGNDAACARHAERSLVIPGFVAFSLFGFAHMLMNGWVG